MRLARSRVLLVAAGLCVPFEAQAAAPSVRVRFAPVSQCADDARVDTELAARHLARARGGEDASYEAEIDVQRVNGQYEARMLLRADGGPPASRTVVAPSCEDVLAALVFTLAVAIDRPPVSPAHPEPEPAPSTPGAPRPEPPPPEAALPRAEGETASPGEPRARETAGAPVPLAPEHLPARRTLRFGFGASSGLASGPAPVVVPTFAIFGEVSAAGDGFGLRARAGAFVILPTTQAALPARFALQAARVDVCPLVLFGALWSCARGELGRIQGETFGVPGALLASGVWGTIELVLAARWSPAPPLFLELEAAAGPTLVHSAFVFGARELYVVPSLAASGALTAGVHFP